MTPGDFGKGAPLISALFVAQLQPVAGPASGNILEYAVTQGGLLCFALVLLYMWRRDNLGKDATAVATIKILTDLVSETKATLVQATETNRALSQTVAQLSGVVAKIEQRKMPR